MGIYYLGFQRAPPCSLVPGSEIHVALTICNDLRDEVYEPLLDETNEEGRVQLTLAWVAVDNKGQKSLLPRQNVQLEWVDAASAYRVLALAVPPRSELRSVKSLHIAVTADKVTSASQQGVHSWQYDLASMQGGKTGAETLFVPCLSDCIAITPSKEEVNNQQRSSSLKREFTYFAKGANKDRQSSILLREESGYALDKHLWDASLHCARWLLADEGLAVLTSARQPGSSALRIVELGAGTGLLSILIASLVPCHVVATDLREFIPRSLREARVLTLSSSADALPLLSENAHCNHRLLAHGSDVSVKELDWEQVESSALVQQGCDIVVVSDCTYNPSSFDALSKAIAALTGSANARSGVTPFCLLAKKHRHIDEDSLWPALAEQHLRADLIYACEPQPASSATSHAHARSGWGLYRIASSD